MNALFATVLAVILALAATVAAQTAGQINATSPATRQNWCLQQTSVCKTYCSQQAPINTCDWKTLAFQCRCKGNDTDVSFNDNIDLTLPFFICLNYKWQPCVNACPAGSQPCQDKCNADFPCGKVKTNPNITVTTTTDSTTATSTPTGIVLDNKNSAVNALASRPALAFAGTFVAMAAVFLL
ncbi:hypothetical protein AMAG_02088 [Allomyces macrogynus ATCC 38327]|uniref:DUF7707 domain-containing protein n=1 Tax=Allomyces macrogynus (strain ATCC 38327) TaxID=578462 RepID=A0A0L0S1L1_ALLM3|nr:hypothetical protein AMAG_02088 [Allomyces macrogynus ATCC 38327]|eukprot:KNE56254.1 hypothetical protein AMAG_02088 [Allomyces macrogynus ATCC 38327]